MLQTFLNDNEILLLNYIWYKYRINKHKPSPLFCWHSCRHWLCVFEHNSVLFQHFGGKLATRTKVGQLFWRTWLLFITRIVSQSKFGISEVSKTMLIGFLYWFVVELSVVKHQKGEHSKHKKQDFKDQLFFFFKKN